MPIPLQQARALISNVQNLTPLANLFAQSDAKHVLFEVQETPENFPAFDPALDDKVTFAAYALLAAGCSLAEQDARSEGVAALERAASLLEYVHKPKAKHASESGFHVLVAAMTFYAAGQYSRSFTSIRLIEEQTAAARVIAAYLRKDVPSLIARLNAILLADTAVFSDQIELNEWVITTAIARAISNATYFIFSGDPNTLRFADQQLQDAGIIGTAGNHPAWWWITRLLRLMLTDLRDASPWNVLPPYIDPDSTVKCRPSLYQGSPANLYQRWSARVYQPEHPTSVGCT